MSEEGGISEARNGYIQCFFFPSDIVKQSIVVIFQISWRKPVLKEMLAKRTISTKVSNGWLLSDTGGQRSLVIKWTSNNSRI